jgi:hypothetical protein
MKNTEEEEVVIMEHAFDANEGAAKIMYKTSVPMIEIL